MDAIDLIIADHRKLQQLFDQLGDQPDGRLLLDLFEALDAHTTAEEEVLYPAMRAALPEGRRLVEAATSEHREAERLMGALQGKLGAATRSAGGTGADAADAAVLADDLGELRRAVERHVRDEERRVLPELRDVLRPDVLEQMARQLAHIEAEETGELDARGTEAIEARLFEASVSPQAAPDDPPATS